VPNKVNGSLPEAPDLSGTAEVIARGRELVEQARRLGEEADRQVEKVQTTIKEAEGALNRANQSLGDKSASHEPAPPPGSASDEEA